MKKYVVALAALCALFMISGCKLGGEKVGVVNPNKVFMECEAGVEGMKMLDTIKEKYEPELNRLQSQMGDDKDKAAQFQKLLAEYQNAIGPEQQRIVDIIRDAFVKAVEKQRKAKGFSVILTNEKVLTMDPKADISDAVIREMNAMKLDIKAPAEAATALEDLTVAPTAETPAPTAETPTPAHAPGN